MKKIILNIKRLMPAFLMALAFSSCLKDKGYDDGLYGAVRNTEGGKYVSIRASGLGNVSKSNVLINTSSTDIDTVDVNIDLDYAEKTTTAITVKIGIDNAKIASYNTDYSANFSATTSDMARLDQTELTIPAGERTVKARLLIDQSKFDPTTSYMIPVTILEASGASLSSNLSTKYFNIIGNPIAGDYEDYFSRWLKADSIGGSSTANYYKLDLGAVTFAPITPTKIQVDGGAFGETFFIEFTNTNGTLSNFKASAPASTAADIGVAAYGPVVLEVADPVHGYYRIFAQYTLASGAIRTLVYEFVKN